MRNNSQRLDHAFGQTPQAFTARIDQTLRHLEEEKPMKRLTLRMVLLTALLLALLGGIACAVVSQGMEWYYHNRFTAYQEYEPQKHEAILNHRQAVQVQEGMEDPLVSVRVCEASWVQEHEMLVISLAAVPVDGGAYELHPAWNLDADGSYVGAESLAEYADDPEARAEHWLWTEKGFGPVGQTMSDPAKTLLLFEAADACLGAMKENLSMMISDSSMDCYVNENGEVMTLLEIGMDWLNPAYDQHQLELAQSQPEFAEMLKERLETVRRMRERVKAGEGKVQITIPYTVTTYSDSDQEMQESRYVKSVTFEMTVDTDDF